jgi:Ca2+-binding EF-hand superfamily protein
MGNKHSGSSSKELTSLSEEQIKLIIENTSFDRDQIIDWHTGFMKDCPNGKMTMERFKLFYNRMYPHGNSDKFCKHAFKLFDHDNSGEITFKEFMLSISIMTFGDIKKKLSLAFQLYDIDQNGFIDRKEMIKVVDAIYSLIDTDDERRKIVSSSVVVDSIMNNLDCNGDNNLSRDEFIEGCLNDSNIKEILVPYL